MEVVYLRKYVNPNGTLCGEDGFKLGIALNMLKRFQVSTDLPEGYERCRKCLELVPE